MKKVLAVRVSGKSSKKRLKTSSAEALTTAISSSSTLADAAALEHLSIYDVINMVIKTVEKMMFTAV